MSENAQNPTPHDRLVSVSALLLGALVIAFLTRYNLQGDAVWSSGPNRPVRSWEEYLVVNLVGLAFLPFLLIFGGFREDAAQFGFRAPERGAARIALLFFLGMVPVLLVVSRFPEFQNYYPIQKQAAYQWGYLLYFEITYGFYFFCWEFFYRGFLTFGMARAFGVPAAIALQAIGFGIMHYSKPTPEFLSSFVGGIALGWLAIRGRSFLPCFALHWAVSLTLDLLAIHARRGAIL